MYSRKRDRNELLCIAAMLNSTLLLGEEKEQSFRDYLLHHLEDYFHFDPHESSQFSKEKTAALIQSLSETDILMMLTEMGKSPFEPDQRLSGERWRSFVDAVWAVPEPA